MNSIRRYIPESINNFLENRIHIYIKWYNNLESKIYELDKEGLIIVCDTILRIAGSREITEDHFVEISSDSFHKILHNDYSLYVDYLVEEKIVISDNWYIPNQKSISYKLNEDYINDIKGIDIKNKLFNKRSIKSINESGKLMVSSTHKKNFKSDFKIDLKSAVDYMNNCYINQIPDHKDRVLDAYTRAILHRKLLEINDKQLYISRSTTNGRINSNLTVLNGDYKQFIVGYDFSLDIVSSQPYMLIMFIELINSLTGAGIYNSYISSYLSYEYKIIQKNLGKVDGTRFLEELKKLISPSQNEVKKWKTLCENGNFYEYFIEEVFNKTGKKFTRKGIKEIIMIVLYSPNKMASEYKKIFNSIFPSIYAFLNKIKGLSKIKRSHKMLPILLQGTESFIWVEMILPQLDKMGIPYHFIHDSIVVKNKDLDRAELKIMEQFYLLKLNPKVKIEKLKK